MFWWVLNFYGNAYEWIRPDLTNLMAGHSESVEILPKCEKMSICFICDFLFLKISFFLLFLATIGFSRPQTPDFE